MSINRSAFLSPALLVLGFSVVSLTTGLFFSATGCSGGTCASAADCGADETCVDGVCHFNYPGRTPGGTGEGGGGIDEEIDLRAPATLFLPGTPDSNLALVGLYDLSTSVDEIESFHITTGVVDDDDEIINFLNLDGGGGSPDLSPCAVDTFFSLNEAFNDDGDAQTWVTCGSEGNSFLMSSSYAIDETRELTELGAVQLAAFLPRDHDDSDAILGRALVAKRGTSQLKAVQFRDDNNALNNPYQLETVDMGAETPTAIGGIFVVRGADDDDGEDADLGDIVFVFDLGEDGDARLIPLQRPTGSQTWSTSLSGSALQPIDLPQNTAALDYMAGVGISDLDTLSFSNDDREVANLLAIQPTAPSSSGFGLARFFRIERLVAGDNSSIRDVDLSFAQEPAMPAASKRILLTSLETSLSSISGQYLYLLGGGSRAAARFSVPADANDDVDDLVLGVDFSRVEEAAHINGVIPLDATRIWISMSNIAKIRLLKLDRQFR